MSARSLPIWAKMVSAYPFLRNVLFAQPFCRILCEQSCILHTTKEERDKIATVAAGGAWA